MVDLRHKHQAGLHGETGKRLPFVLCRPPFALRFSPFTSSPSLPDLSSPSSVSPENEQGGAMSLFEHLAELRQRVIRFFLVFVVCFIASYAFRTEILDVMRDPVVGPLAKYRVEAERVEGQRSQAEDFKPDHFSCDCEETSVAEDGGQVRLSCVCTRLANATATARSGSSELVFLGLTELFFTQLKAAFFFALFLAFPYLMIQVWGFVGPALYKKEKKVFWWFAVSSYFCFIGGALFGYFIVFPFGFDFFLSLSQPGEIMPNLAIGEYFAFSLKLLFAFGIVFELPVITLVLSRLGLLTARWMIVNSKYAVLAIFALSAILTPPDPFTMMLMAVPLCSLYVLSVFICFLGQRRDKKGDASLS